MFFVNHNQHCNMLFNCMCILTKHFNVSNLTEMKKNMLIDNRRKVSIKGAKVSRYYSHLYITIVTNPLPVFYSKFSVTKLQCDETSVNRRY